MIPKFRISCKNKILGEVGGIEMTEKLGILLTSKRDTFKYVDEWFTLRRSYFSEFAKHNAYKCTQDEAKECFPQFRWVALEEL